MIYRKFKDVELSWLGYGIMRMPVKEQRGPIDAETAMELIDHAYKNGVNFFDTAYFYHSGESQSFIGKALSRYPRHTWYLSNKFPGNIVKVAPGGIATEQFGDLAGATFSGIAELFEKQLKDCNVEYFDFYMLHNVCESTYDLYTNEELGIVDYFLRQKEAGRIRHLGFSTHGMAETIEKFLKWRDCFEFALVQLNYLDWHLQEAGKKYEVCTKHNVPVFVMEPVRGGKLANPGDEAVKLLKAERPNDTAAAWAFRFLQSLENVVTVFSGMTTMEQLNENLGIFSKNNPTTKNEREILNKAVETMAEMVPCTSCRYCVDICPVKLDIPMLLTLYNEKAFDNAAWTVNSVLRALKDGEKPQACTACGACSPLCPQNIDIAGAISKFNGLLSNLS